MCVRPLAASFCRTRWPAAAPPRRGTPPRSRLCLSPVLCAGRYLLPSYVRAPYPGARCDASVERLAFSVWGARHTVLGASVGRGGFVPGDGAREASPEGLQSRSRRHAPALLSAGPVAVAMRRDAARSPLPSSWAFSRWARCSTGPHPPKGHTYGQHCL